MQCVRNLRKDFSSLLAFVFWSFLAILLVPLSIHPRLYDLANPLIEPHPWRQNQTALTSYYFHKGFGSFFDYRSPLDGKLWNYVIEFPLYQWLVGKLMHTGLSLEVSGRLVSLLCFFVGSLFLYHTVERLLSKEVALWTWVIYLISPFNIVYSRVFLIDPFVQCFCLMTGYCCTRLVGRSFKVTPFFLTTVLGVVASMGKVTVWFSLALCLSMILFYLVFIRKNPWQEYRFVLLSFFIQGVFALLWMAWSSKIYALNGSYNAPRWFFGEVFQRFQWEDWQVLFKTVGRNYFADFLTLPFLIAFLWGRENRAARMIGLLTILVPVLILFNIHVHHDYYFITESPYLCILAALGLESLFRIEKTWVRTTFLFLMMVLLVRKLVHYDDSVGILYHDYRPDIAEALKLKQLTQEKELIYYESDSAGRYWIPLYSERYVLLAPSIYFGEGPAYSNNLKPDVFWLETEESFQRLKNYSTVELSTDGSEFSIYRVFENFSEKSFPLSMPRVSTRSDAMPKKISSEFTPHVISCGAKSGHIVLNFQGVYARIVLRSHSNGNDYTLPYRPFLYLPAESILGCDYDVSLRK